MGYRARGGRASLRSFNTYGRKTNIKTKISSRSVVELRVGRFAIDGFMSYGQEFARLAKFWPLSAVELTVRLSVRICALIGRVLDCSRTHRETVCGCSTLTKRSYLCFDWESFDCSRTHHESVFGCSNLIKRLYVFVF